MIWILFAACSGTGQGCFVLVVLRLSSPDPSHMDSRTRYLLQKIDQILADMPQ